MSNTVTKNNSGWSEILPLVPTYSTYVTLFRKKKWWQLGCCV